MKLLLDENIPRKLKNDLLPHEVLTIREMKWDGKENGALLNLMIAEGFEALITADKNIAFQQNFQKYPIPVLILNAFDNTYETIKLFAPAIKEALLTGLSNGPTLINL